MEDIDKAVEMIEEAKRPFVFVGGGAILSDASEELRAFVDKVQCPVCDSLMGKGAFPGTDELYTGMLGMHGTKTSNFGVSECDLLIVVGARFSDRVTGNPNKFASNAKILQFDIDVAEMNKNVIIDEGVVGDIKEVLAAVNEKLPQQEGQAGLPHPKIALPRDLYGKGRENSGGLDLANEHRLASLSSALLNSALQKWHAKPMLEHPVADGEMTPVVNPAEPKDIVGYVREATHSEVEQALQLCRERKPLGLLFLGGNPEFFKQGFAKVGVPSVLVTNRANNLPFENLSSVATDDIAAGKCAVDALLEAGHDKIGIIGGDPVKSYTSHQRYLGCKESFAEHGKEMDLEVCYEKARFSFDSAYRAMKRLVEKYPDLTAVFAMSDVMAIGAIRALRDLGYRVPEDVSVIGFDGTSLAEYYNPKLATIKQQHQTLANRSIEILFGQIELKKEPIHEIVPFEFVNGESIRVIDER